MDKLIRTIENKEIIFVGNSIEILQHKKGEWIDSHDIVVRFGKGMPTPDKYESIGQRTDIWISGFLRSKHQVYYPMALKLLNRARVDLDSDVSRHKVGKDWITMFTDDELKSIYEEFGIKNNDFHAKRPSNGFISILFFTRMVHVWKKLSLIGFDFFAKDAGFKVGNAVPYSWHLPINTVNENPHMGATERGYVMDLVRKNILDWKILSDLEEKSVDFT
tara:strand:+ start:233 stop:889 length:657 start_codon:yes stop_codon:yes gene_type:complete